ncbi:hypothetical protein NQZ68_035953 [Dissostichus eleginoides]|nr:hypothetical protein NQZ68_035953 [Dissostichus eleginoides]
MGEIGKGVAHLTEPSVSQPIKRSQHGNMRQLQGFVLFKSAEVEQLARVQHRTKDSDLAQRNPGNYRLTRPPQSFHPGAGPDSVCRVAQSPALQLLVAKYSGSVELLEIMKRRRLVCADRIERSGQGTHEWENCNPGKAFVMCSQGSPAAKGGKKLIEDTCVQMLKVRSNTAVSRARHSEGNNGRLTAHNWDVEYVALVTTTLSLSLLGWDALSQDSPRKLHPDPSIGGLRTVFEGCHPQCRSVRDSPPSTGPSAFALLPSPCHVSKGSDRNALRAEKQVPVDSGRGFEPRLSPQAIHSYT